MRPSTTDGRPAFGRHDRNVRACCAEVAQVLGHLGRTRRAVQADHVGRMRLEGRERGADLGADEHAARRLDRDLDHQRDRDPGAVHRAPGRDQRSLALEQVLDGLDEEHVDAPLEQPLHLGDVRVAELGEPDVPERGQLRARADGSDHEPRAVGRRVAGRHLAGELRGDQVELAGLLGDVVLGQHDREGAERRGLDRVDAHRRRSRRACGGSRRVASAPGARCSPRGRGPRSRRR